MQKKDANNLSSEIKRSKRQDSQDITLVEDSIFSTDGKKNKMDGAAAYRAHTASGSVDELYDPSGSQNAAKNSKFKQKVRQRRDNTDYINVTEESSHKSLMSKTFQSHISSSRHPIFKQSRTEGSKRTIVSTTPVAGIESNAVLKPRSTFHNYVCEALL